MVKYSMKYHHVRKVRATHIMLDCRTTIIAFSECTELHAANTHCQQSCKLSMHLQKDSQVKTIQIVFNSIDCFIITTKILVTKKFIQV